MCENCDHKKETRRQRSARIKQLLSSISCDDTSKVYDCESLQDNSIIKSYNPEDYDKLSRYVVQYCPKCKQYTIHYTISRKCVTCQSKETGLGNPDTHAKTIKSQLNNGTFNMMNHDVQINKSSNKNLKHEDKLLYCDNCGKETIHRVWKNGKIRCRNCDFKNNGYRIKYCEICDKDTPHNGSVCMECNPKAGYQYSKGFKQSIQDPGECTHCGKHVETCSISGLCKDCNGYIRSQKYKHSIQYLDYNHIEYITTTSGINYTINEILELGYEPEDIKSGKTIMPNELCVCGNQLPIKDGWIADTRCSEECRRLHWRHWEKHGMIRAKSGIYYRDTDILNQGLNIEDKT